MALGLSYYSFGDWVNHGSTWYTEIVWLVWWVRT